MQCLVLCAMLNSVFLFYSRGIQHQRRKADRASCLSKPQEDKPFRISARAEKTQGNRHEYVPFYPAMIATWSTGMFLIGVVIVQTVAVVEEVHNSFK